MNDRIRDDNILKVDHAPLTFRASGDVITRCTVVLNAVAMHVMSVYAC